jgi:leucyl/phenylalanyl-tRNA--protein transferase
MPIYLLTDALSFPPPQGASEEGIVAVGGDLSVPRLLLAYRQGIFPWPVAEMPLLWFSPDPRWVLLPGRVHLSRSLRRRLRQEPYQVTADRVFPEVIRECAEIPRPHQDGTWITDEVRRAYVELHRAGYAHSVEAWREGRLVGGLYGVSVGRAFFGESMFTRLPDASKIALVTLLGNLAAWNFAFLDCQIESEHVVRLGAVPWPRTRFLRVLREAVAAPTREGPWTLDFGPREAGERLERGARSAVD